MNDDLAELLAKKHPSIYPIRQQRPSPVIKPSSPVARSCRTCGADFFALSPGATGERGIWRDWRWYCSVECDPEEGEA